jgi:hypothetical protein
VCGLQQQAVSLFGLSEPFLRPGLTIKSAPRAVSVKTGRRPPPWAARSGLDGREHDASLDRAGALYHVLPGHGSFRAIPRSKRTCRAR